MVGRDHADAEVELLVADGDLDAAVLGAAAFGDVDLGENLDTRQEGAQQPPGGAVAFDQHAVDAVADPDAILERLDVDVGGPQLHRFGDHQLHQPDDRGAVLVDFVFAGPALVFGLGEVDRRVGEFLEHRVGALALRLAVVAVDRFQNAFPRGQGDVDLAVQDEPQLFDRVESNGSLTMTFSPPSSSASGSTAFSRATDSGTSSTTEGGITTSLRST